MTSLPLLRRKKARTEGEGDSYDPYDFSDAEEEMPEGESLQFVTLLLKVLLLSVLVGLCTWGAVMVWGHSGSLALRGITHQHQPRLVTPHGQVGQQN